MSTRDSAASTGDRLAGREEFAREARDGLTRPGQKELPSKYLYDEVGSALFEVITLLPEYGLTRAGERLLRRHATSIIERLSSPVIVCELGSGTGRKTRWILEALARREPVTYYPIDVSASALAICERNLGVLEDVSVVGMEASYLDGLRRVGRERQDRQTMLVLFLGSSIGNFDRAVAERFLTEVRACLAPRDALLLAADLQDSVEALTRAYDDGIGVTAAFNRNILARINRELGGDFDLGAFHHEARYDPAEHRVEMHLRASSRQTVTIPASGLTCHFEPGETIWTESSHKYRLHELPAMAHRAGFQSDAQWVDPEWPFAQNLWLAV